MLMHPFAILMHARRVCGAASLSVQPCSVRTLVHCRSQRITSKNSWTLPLIDHMDSLIAGERAPSQAHGDGATRAPEPKRGVAASKPAVASASGSGHADVDAALTNFTRASCALDASIRIYR